MSTNHSEDIGPRRNRKSAIVTMNAVLLLFAAAGALLVMGYGFMRFFGFTPSVPLMIGLAFFVLALITAVIRNRYEGLLALVAWICMTGLGFAIGELSGTGLPPFFYEVMPWTFVGMSVVSFGMSLSQARQAAG